MKGAAAKHSKKSKPDDAPKERKNTAVYVTSLPSDVDVEEVEQVFSRYGVIAESLDSDAPRIKLYTDDNGNFRGEALIGKVLMHK
jgi:HIV Tat-specific factor 1